MATASPTSTSPALVAFHTAHGKRRDGDRRRAARPLRRAVDLDGDRVSRFIEKPPGDNGLINGGFFVLQPVGARPHRRRRDALGDRAARSAWPRDGELMAFRHDGFWQPMDTLRDKNQLEELWASGKAPWKVWA